MNMKELVLPIVTTLIATVCASAQVATNPLPWTATIHVVDESGKPVARANVEVGYYVHPPPGQTQASEKIEGLTDTNGLFVASHADRSISLGFRAAKAGYYSSSCGHTLFLPGQFNQQIVASNRNPTVSLLLKKIANPIPMYARLVDHGPPVLNEPVGFDLTVGDWVAPHGEGQMKDFIFAKTYTFKSTSDYEGRVTLTFSSPGDGIQVIQPTGLEKTSALRSPHEAPESGYEPQLARETSAHPGQPSKFEYDPNRIYLFRVRTTLDEKGNVKSALYGKIYGDFMQFRYHMNPTPNDRNVEFDPKHNLLTGLKSFEQVSAP